MGMEMSWFRDGKLGIYELMTEEAGVNFWEVRTPRRPPFLFTCGSLISLSPFPARQQYCSSTCSSVSFWVFVY